MGMASPPKNANLCLRGDIAKEGKTGKKVLLHSPPKDLRILFLAILPHRLFILSFTPFSPRHNLPNISADSKMIGILFPVILFLICPKCLANSPQIDHPIRIPNPFLHFLLTIKTTRANHSTRLKEAVQSWANIEDRPDGVKIVFVSDSPFPSPNFELIDSGCSSGHQNEALCCKLATEMRLALEQRPNFWCHFDDDSFVVLPNLLAHFRRFSPQNDLFIGHASISEPISLEIDNRNDSIFGQKFWFGTGGAGFCLSKSTLKKLEPFLGHFESICAQLGTPDDVALGFMLGNLLGIKFTNSPFFHSHLETLKSIPPAILGKQISLSGSVEGGNFVNVPRARFDGPLRFKSMQRFFKRTKEKRKKGNEGNIP